MEDQKRMRIIFDNAANRATLSASSTAGALVAANMLTDVKAQIYRSVGTTATLTALWPSGERIGGAHLVFTNFTSSAKMRVRLYTYEDDTVPYYSGDWVFCCAGRPLGSFNWGTTPLGVNSFTYGGAAYGRVWVDPSAVARRMEIDIEDTWNPAGFLEVSRLVCGNYWEPKLNPDWGAGLGTTTTSTQSESAGGDLVTDRGSIRRKLNLAMSKMDRDDRAQMWQIYTRNGIDVPIFLSMYPLHTDSIFEQDHQIYGKLTPANSTITTPAFGNYSASLELKEM